MAIRLESMNTGELAIYGVGLIGGSLALSARRAGVRRIVGVDRFAAPPPVGVVDAWVHADDETAVEKALSGVQLAVLAVPVGVVLEVLPRALASGAVVTDCGSTKRAIVERVRDHAQRSRFVPGHPMAGHPEGGLTNARADLFEGRRWILCTEGADARAVARVTELVRAVGAVPVFLDAEAHDRAVALTSHVPQLVASALAVLSAEQDAGAAAGPGFASATRVAGGAESMWRDIFETNPDAVASALRKLGSELDEVAAGLERGDAASALELLARARRVLGRG
jgi:prephenate dehydrogenase